MLAAGCANDDSDAGAVDQSTSPDATDAATNPAPDDGSGDDVGSFESEQCDLFTGDEITAVIGPHDGGQQDFQLGGCVWTATTADADGFTPAIQATVTEPDLYEMVAESGEPVEWLRRLAPAYAGVYGEFGFTAIATGTCCGVKGDIADGASGQGTIIDTLSGALLRDRN